MKAVEKFKDVLFSPKTAGFAALAAAITLAVCAVWWGGLNQDEGWYLYAAQCVRAGRLPYRDFFFTQGPVFPFVYSRLAPVWTSWNSPVHGILGGRVLTLAFGTLATLATAAVARRLAPPKCRGAAALSVFVLLACNVYHVYFTSLVKTYALSSFLLMSGFLAFSCALSLRRFSGAAAAAARVALYAASGLAMALASGTRISLLLVPAVSGLALFFTMKRRGAAFLWFGAGLAAGLWPVYGVFAVDDASRACLLAAQSFHASRGGFDIYNAVGSVSRLVRSYLPLCCTLAAAALLAVRRRASLPAAPAIPAAERDPAETERLFAMRTMAASFAAVFLLQISAPFPYDDYQVPLMGIAAALASVCLFRALGDSAEGRGMAAFAILVCAGFCAFSSPLLQQWFTAGQDRFWVKRRERPPLEDLARAAHEIELLDPDGSTLLTQDLYLAVESGRSVPEGFEMGPFCYFPDISDEEAASMHVFNRKGLEKFLKDADLPRVAAVSGYGFAIAAPKMDELPDEDQMAIFRLLGRRFDRVGPQERFGQNDTTLWLYKAKGPAKGGVR